MPAAAAARAGLAVLVVAAVCATWIVAGPVPPPDFLGFFTIQANLIGVAVLAVGAVRLARGARVTRVWSVVRWSAATYLTVVGVVYWLVLAPLGAAGGIALPWANLVLHALTPVAAVLDLALIHDGRRPPLGLVPAVLAYPLVWTVVVLVRGATDGWVPYPFLDPSQGAAVLAAWVALVAGAFTGAALLLRLVVRRPVSRTR